MTGVTTQQPVAWQNSLKPCEIYADDDLELVWKQCPTFLPLYTTDQAEAYAAAKVREALEEAARICDAQSKEWDSDSLITEKDYAEFCAVSIRKLIK